ncbi:MAG TPA: glycosyltransferase [Candidatus Saccharimonadales bacterium]|nr:glycosyltransferase [Candidatus Saccharimonadales bacterium]
MQKKKTVLIYHNELLPLSETFIKEQILALENWRAVLIGRRLLNQLPLDNLDVRIVGPERPTFQSRLLWKASRMLRTTPSHIKRGLKAERASLIHAHFGPDALDAWPLARALKLPLLVTLHGYDINIYREWWEAGNAGIRMRFYPRRLLQLARQPRVSFIAVSEAIRRRAIDFGIPAEKIAVSYIGVDTSKFTPGDIPVEQRPPHILFVGRLVEKKGCQYLIEAMSIVQKNVPAARLIVVGGGPLRQDLELFARRLGVQADFRGAQSSADVKRELDAARVLCLPSVTAENGDAEGFGLVLLEAQASGVPVVTSAQGGATEGIRDGVTGFSFAEGDVGVLAKMLINLLNDDIILVQMAEKGPQYVSKGFNLTDCARQLEALYNTSSI